MTEKEKTEVQIVHMGRGAEVLAAMAGPDNMFLAFEFLDSEGKQIRMQYESPKALLSLYEAIGNAQSMTLIRNMNLFNMLHEEVGCAQAHELLARSLEDLIEPPTEAEPPKPHLQIVPNSTH